MTETKKFIWAWRIAVLLFSVPVIISIGANETGFWFGLAALIMSFAGEYWLKQIGKKGNGGTY
jgi:hypothetical protein